jgi:hypothetical protein
MTKPRRSEVAARRKLRYRVESASLAIGSALESARSLCDVVPHEGDYVLRAVANRLAIAASIVGECEGLMEGKK